MLVFVRKQVRFMGCKGVLTVFPMREVRAGLSMSKIP